MKAVIVEIKGNIAAVLSEGGRISKIKNKNYAAGQEIILKNTGKYIKLTVAAVIVLFLAASWAYFEGFFTL